MKSEVSVRIKPGLARPHFTSAKIHRDRMSEIEAEFNPTTIDQSTKNKIRDEHRAAFFGCIFSGAAVIESFANEFTHNAIEEAERIRNDDNRVRFQEIDNEILFSIADHGNALHEVDYHSPSSKSLNKILDIAGKEKINNSSEIQRNVNALFKMRNRLYHHIPKWIDGGPKKATKNEYGFEKQLKGKFELNPLTSEGNAFFPSQSASASCGEWAVKNVHSLIAEFGDRIGYEPNFPDY